MMPRLCAYVVASWALLSAAAIQAENWFTHWWDDCRITTARNNAWPEPFIPSDRATARAPFAVCVANGWRLQNTLDDHHFDADTGKLTEAGELKVQTIVTRTPIPYRVVFVLRSERPDITAARMASAQEAAARFAIGDVAPVGETVDRPRGTPGYYVVDIERSLRDSTPPPRLPVLSGATSSGTSSSGSGS
jgi:hypothetical protein